MPVSSRDTRRPGSFQGGTLVPRFLALWGAVGYLLHFAGAVAELFGLHISMFLLIPGGLFEVTFGISFLVKGITSRTDIAEQ